MAALFIAACTAPQAPARQRPPENTSAPAGAPTGLPGGRVLFSKAGIDLWSSTPDGGGRVAVTHDGSTGGYVGARWSPDGSLIAAERALPDENGTSLYVLRADAAPLRLSGRDTFLDGYAWSPDGRYLTYGEVVSGATAAAGGLTLVGAVGDVHLYDTQTGVNRIIGPGTHPAFSPDGTHLGYAHLSGAIASVDLRALDQVAVTDRLPTQMVVTLADLTRVSSTIAPRGMGLIGGPSSSPDGKLIAYAAIENGPILEA